MVAKLSVVILEVIEDFVGDDMWQGGVVFLEKRWLTFTEFKQILKANWTQSALNGGSVHVVT